MPGREHPVSLLEGFSRRGALALSPQEEMSLHFGQRAHLLTVAVGLLSVAVALVAGQTAWVGAAGLVYVLMGPLHGWNGYRLGQALEVADRAA